MTEAFYMSVASLTGERFAELYAAAPKHRQAKIDAYRFDSDKRLSLGAWVLLSAAFDRLGLPFDPSAYAVTANGKPYLVGSPYHFSITHTGEVVAVAVSDSPCGIDAEVIARQSRRIAERFFHPAESAYLAAFDSDAYDAEFTEIWTKKEAFAKLTGEGIADFASFSTVGDLPCVISTCRIAGTVISVASADQCSGVEEVSLG